MQCTYTSRQGNNARKVILEMYTFFVLQFTVFWRKSYTRRISQPDMESIFTKIIYEIFWLLETIKCELSKLSKLNALITELYEKKGI